MIRTWASTAASSALWAVVHDSRLACVADRAPAFRRPFGAQRCPGRSQVVMFVVVVAVNLVIELLIDTLGDLQVVSSELFRAAGCGGRSAPVTAAAACSPSSGACRDLSCLPGRSALLSVLPRF
jgi:hypothetical protein